MSTSLGRREAAEAEAQRALRELVAATERAQHIRGFFRSRRARGAGGHRELAQRELQALAFDAVEADVEQPAHALLRMAVQLDAADARRCLPTAGRAARAMRATSAARSRSRDLEREAHADDLVRRERARAQAVLLAAAVDQRLEAERRLATHVQRADALRAVDLVRRERQQVDVHRLDDQRQLAGALRGVDVERDAALAADRADGGDVLHDADLVVHVHQRDELRVGAQRRPHLLRPHDAVGVRASAR